jgi:hypothetical protein
VKRRIAIGACLLALGAAEPASALPDLSITLPQLRTATQIAPVYVDAYEEPGHVLYRFDALIHNEGSTLDLFRRESDGHVMQALWDGDPDAMPDPYAEPTGVALDDRTEQTGARIEYVFEKTHDHFHFFTAARYGLLVPGAEPRASGKIGFCLFDSFDDAGGPVQWFAPDRPWCHSPADRPGFARMGLSPGAADRYSSQRELQYVDITGLMPGTYTLRGTANPDSDVLESDGVPDVHEEPREIPGVLADPASAAAQDGPVEIRPATRLTGTGIPGRLSADCTPRSTVDDCYAWVQPGDPVRLAATAPEHGTVAASRSALTYSPAPGFSGEDRFSYTATDARGLVSAPAPVAVTVTQPVVVRDPPPALSRQLLAIRSARRSGRRIVTVRVRCLPRASGTCAGRVAARARGRGIGARRFSGLLPGRTVTLRIRHTPTRRRITVRATVRDTTGVGLAASRIARSG